MIKNRLKKNKKIAFVYIGIVFFSIFFLEAADHRPDDAGHRAHDGARDGRERPGHAGKQPAHHRNGLLDHFDLI